MRVVLLTVLLVGCGSPTAAPADPSGGSGTTGDPTASCTEAYDVGFSPGTVFEDVSPEAAAPFPAGVSFSAAVSRAGGAVRIEGVLRNRTAAAVAVDYLTGGVMGISTNPFQVDIDVQPRAATGPEIYPAPRRVVLPANGRVTYTVTRCPTLPARVRWTFTPWRGDAVQGDVVVGARDDSSR